MSKRVVLAIASFIVIAIMSLAWSVTPGIVSAQEG
jgi:hypothetical protein